jgi:sugar/nucleoside kinase (ribokinase family)
MIGVGGIGSGKFFALNHNHTLGREESRSGHFLDRMDYCKLHIICHYVKTLLGPDFICIPVGKVGSDEIGSQLIAEMDEIGLNTRWVRKIEDAPTLFSFCFIYPDGTGGNLTTDDSACGRVDAEYVSLVQDEFQRFENSGVALAVPEFPLPAREKVLELGTRYHFFRIASFSTEEICAEIAKGILLSCDWLAMNVDEASVVVGMKPDQYSVERIVNIAIERLAHLAPQLRISVTAGKFGSWVWDHECLDYHSAFAVSSVSTAGAGDAHLAGILAGVIAGLSTSESHELGSLVAALSVTSPHTIDKRIGRETLQNFIQNEHFNVSYKIRNLLG